MQYTLNKGQARLLAVVGPSGSGKSSVVKAGLLPQLQGGALAGSEHWIYPDPIVPGKRPIESLALTLEPHLQHKSIKVIREDLDDDSQRGLHHLATRLIRPQSTKATREDLQDDSQRGHQHLATRLIKPQGTRVVLLIDQFEELFSQSVAEQERQQMIDLLLTAATEPGGPVVLLLTLRADFYDRPMRYSALIRLLQEHTISVLPMDLQELRAVIEEPAALPDVQLNFEGNLVGDLLFETYGQVGALPLLEFTLDELFRQREGHWIMQRAYEQMGGVKGALARHAEATYNSLPTQEHRRLARRLFLRLIDLGVAEVDSTRRRAPLSELVLPDAQQTKMLQEVANAFVAARLLTTSATSDTNLIEVSHEALISQWPRLSRWLSEAHEDIFLQQTISADAAEWERRDLPVERLYRGSQLTEALAWSERNDPAQAEAEFLAAAVRESEHQERLKQEQGRLELEQQKREVHLKRQTVNRLYALMTVLTLLLVASVIFALVAQSLRQVAMANEAKALMQEHTADSRALASAASAALTDKETDLALLLSVKALQVQETSEARNSLFSALMQSPRLAGILSNGYNYPGQFSQIISLAFSEEGKTLYAYDGFHVFRWIVQTHKYQQINLPVAHGPGGTLGTIAFSPDNRTLGIVNASGIWLVDLQTNTARPPLTSQILDPSAVANSAITFSRDGSLVAANRCDRYPPFSPGQPRPPCAENGVSIWNTQSTQSTSLSFIVNTDILGLAFSPDGKELAIANPTGILVVDTITSQQIVFLAMNNVAMAGVSIAFSPDGTKLAAGSDDRTIHLWDTVFWNPLTSLTGHEGTVFSIAFSHDGKTLASTSQNGTVRLWDIGTSKELGTSLTGHRKRVFSVAFSSDDKMLASGGEDGSIMLWDVNAEGTINQRLADASGAHSPLFSSDGKTIFIGTDDGKVLLLDSGTGKLQATLDDVSAYPLPPLTGKQMSAIKSIACSADGKILAAGRADGTILLWDLNTRRVLPTSPLKYSGRLSKIMLSADGHLLVAGGDGKVVMLWDVIRGGDASVFPVNSLPVIGSPVALSSDGKLLAAGSCTTSQGDCSKSEVLLWAVGTGTSPTHVLAGHPGPFLDVAFNPDGYTLAASGIDGIKLWDTTKQALITTFAVATPPGEGSMYYGSIRFSPNGKQLLSFSGFGQSIFVFTVWNVLQREPLVQTFWETVSQGGLAFSPDSQRLVSVFTRDGKNILLLWDISVSAWQNRGCAIAHRNLTQDEWKEFVKDEQQRTKVCTDFPFGS